MRKLKNRRIPNGTYGGVRGRRAEARLLLDTYKGYLNVPCILYSVAVFVFIKVHSDEVMAKVGGVVRWLKDYTFAVFLMHYFIINIFVRIFHIHTHSLVYRIFGAIVISIICIFIAAIIRKIPYGRKILP